MIRVLRSARYLVLVILAAAAVLSATKGAEIASSPSHYEKTIQTLDRLKVNATGLAMTTTGASIAVSALPDDTATPIAEKLSDLGMYMFFVVCAIFLEKYMLTIAGFFTFKFIFPFACLWLAVGLFSRSDRAFRLATKLIVTGIMLCSLVPLGAMVSDMIIETKEYSINEILETALASTDEEIDTEAIEAAMEADKEKKGVLGTLASLPGVIKNAASATISKISEALSHITIENAQILLNNLLEAVAVMLITTCAIPIIILLIYAAFFKMLMHHENTVYLPADYNH